MKLWGLVVLAGCGRVGFDTTGDGGAGGSNAPGSAVDLDFVAGETTDLVFTRATTATYVDAAGVIRVAGPGVPRFDHDPISHAPLGLLVERASDNSVHQAAQLDGADWFTNGGILVNADLVVAPNGLMAAEEITDTDTLASCRRAQSLAPVADDAEPYTCSVFAKAGTTSRMSIGCEVLGGGALQQVQEEYVVDLSNGTTVQAPGTAATLGYGIEPYPDGWYRLWIAVGNNGQGNTQPVLSVWSDRTNDPATGTFYAWGAMFEHAPYATSVIVNEGLSTLQRDADRVRLPLTGPDLVEGTLRVVARPRYDAFTTAAAVVASSLQQININRDPSSNELAAAVSGTSTIQLTGGDWPLGTARWAAVAWTASEVTFGDDAGNQGGTSNTVATPFSQIVLGTDLVVDSVVRIARVTEWPTVRTSAELVLLAP